MMPDFGAHWAALPGKPDPRFEHAKTLLTSQDHIPKFRGAVNAYVNTAIVDAPPRPVWQTAAETLARGAGCCVDKALLKRALLLARGALPAQLYLIVGHDMVIGDHAFLWFHGDILDSVGRDDMPRKPDDYAGVFRPMFAHGVDDWVYGERVK